MLNYAAAVGSGVVANVLLGLSSLYWKELAAIPATTLLGYRIFVSLATLSIVMAFLGRFKAIRRRINGKSVLIHGAAAVLVVVNWGTFIWASIHSHVIESGLGYLVAPFVAIGGGVLIFSDKMNMFRYLSLTIIAAGILILIARSSELSHWVYLTIGVTWGGYACLKKITSLDAFEGLFCETVVLSVILLALMVTPSLTMRLPERLPDRSIVVLAAAGLVSVTPLWLFAKAASGLPLSVMGLFQFVLPTTQLIVALVFYHQNVSINTMVCFGAIWMALLIIVAEPLLQRLAAALF
jgi:chloramphenicol-sensitive protein RarD